MKSCWYMEPERRPSFKDLLATLDSEIASYVSPSRLYPLPDFENLPFNPAFVNENNAYINENAGVAGYHENNAYVNDNPEIADEDKDKEVPVYLQLVSVPEKIDDLSVPEKNDVLISKNKI